MAEICTECGAPIGAGRTCLDGLHDLLGLESRVAGGAGREAHFYAVATYVIQHPEGMGATRPGLAALVAAVRDVVAGAASTEDVRAAVGSAAGGAARVRRRPGDGVPRWPVDSWTVTVADVLAAGEEGYGDAVARWAAATLGDLDRLGEPDGLADPDGPGDPDGRLVG